MDYLGAARATIHQRQYLMLVGVTAPLFGAFGLHCAVVADERLINLDHTATGAEIDTAVIPHGLADVVRHEPRRLYRDAQRAM